MGKIKGGGERIFFKKNNQKKIMKHKYFFHANFESVGGEAGTVGRCGGAVVSE